MFSCRSVIPILSLLFTCAFGINTLPGTSHAAEELPAQTLKRLFPSLKPQTVAPSPVKGLYEVVLEDRVIYFAPESGHLLVGNLISQEGENLTRNRFNLVMAERKKLLPLDKALKIGSGPHTVIEITDPDCPYCRKGDKFLESRNDVTRYIFFMPLAMHPNAPQKAAFILSAGDPVQAYRDVMAGKYDQTPLPAFTANSRYQEHQGAVTQLGITGTPNYWINGSYVSGADLDTMRKLLDTPLPPVNR